MANHIEHTNERIGFTVPLSRNWRKSMKCVFLRNKEVFNSSTYSATLQVHAKGAVNGKGSSEDRKQSIVDFLTGWKMLCRSEDLEALDHSVEGGEDSVCLRYWSPSGYGKIISTLRDGEEYWIKVNCKNRRYESSVDLALGRIRLH